MTRRSQGPLLFSVVSILFKRFARSQKNKIAEDFAPVYRQGIIESRDWPSTLDTVLFGRLVEFHSGDVKRRKGRKANRRLCARPLGTFPSFTVEHPEKRKWRFLGGP